jgi:hypothetical protein
MASFPSVTMTTEGLNMIAKASSGNSEDRLIVTKVKFGDGVSEGNIREYTDVINPKMEVTLAEWENRGDGRFRYTFTYNNKGIKTGFYHREIGLFAKSGNDGGEKLIAYSNAGSYPGYIDDETKEIPYQRLMINIGVGDTNNVTGQVDVSNAVTIEMLDEHDADENAHEKLIKKLFGSSEATLESVKEKVNDWAKEVCLPLSGGEMTGDITANNVYANNNVLVFNNVAEMKASNKVKAGYTLKTLGFYITDDGGGANYFVTDNIGEDEVDEASVITLQKGLYAKLLIQDYVNIKQLGVKGVEETDTTEIIQKILANNNIKEVYFPEGIYIIRDSININRPIKIRGENAENTIIKVKDFLAYVPGSSIWIILLTNSGAIFENIQLQQNLTDTENKGMLLGFKNAQNIIFKNCFIFQNEQDFGYVDLNTNNKNITFENCEFKTIIKTKTIKGTGCVMVREGYTEKVTENIYFNNCIFDHESADESIGVWDWFGTVKNVFLNNCTFNDANGTSLSQHFMTLNLKDKSVFLNNCTINRSGDNAFSIVKGGYGSNISNCIFNLNLSSLINGCFIGSPNINNCIIKNSNLNKLLDFNQLLDTDSPKAINEGFNLNNCKINGFRNFNHGKIFNSILDMQSDNVFDLVVGAEIELNNCTISNAKCQTFTNKPDSVNSLFKLINCTIQGNLQTNNFIILGENANINIQGTIIDVNNNFTITAPNSTGIIDYISYNNAFSNSINLGEKVINQIKNITTE